MLSGDFKRPENYFFLLISDAYAVISYTLIPYSALFLYFVKKKGGCLKERDTLELILFYFILLEGRKDFSELIAASHTGFKLFEILQLWK